jgi:hypothetical protein
MRVVVDAELVRHGQEQRVGLGNRLVLRKLLDQRIRLVGVAASEDGARVFLDEADLVFFLSAAASRSSRREIVVSEANGLPSAM